MAAIAIAAYEPYVERIGRCPAPMSQDYRQVAGAGHGWVACIDEVVVGFVVLIPSSDHVLIENIAVRPDQQCRGIGRRLMEFAETHAAELGRHELRLFTHVAMVENLQLYQRLGYRETHRATDNGFDRVFLRKRTHDSG